MKIFGFLLLALGLGQAIAASERRETLGEDDITIEDMQRMQGALETRGLAQDIWEDIKDAASCTACQSVLVLLKGLAVFGDRNFVKVLQEVCKISGAMDDDVCDGAIALEGPIIAKAIRNMHIGSKTSKLFCITFLGLCPYPDVAEYEVEFPTPKPAGGRPAPSGNETLKIVHFSDIHIDHLYVPGSNAECTKPICCRPYTEEDSPGNTDSPAGPMGDHNCDVPVSLEESMFAAIKELVPDAAFSIFTGDIVDHAVWNTSEEYNEFSISDSYARMAQSLGTVYGTAGNHEQHPTNAFQPNELGDEAQWVYDTLSSSWRQWIGSSAASQSEDLGAFSTRYPNGNLRVISMSTNMYYKQNYWLYEREMRRDPNGQLEWLVRELDAAERAGENVYIIGHMPMGSHDAFRDGSNYFDQIVNRYSSTIAAMFFGHTHKDHFQISYSDYSNRTAANALATSFIGPSLTPTSGMPAFRVYDVDPATFAVMDATTYMADMDDPDFQTKPVWKKYYSAKETYGRLVDPAVSADGDDVVELTPAFWHEVTEAFERDDDEFQAYMLRKRRGWVKGDEDEPCSGECKEREICELRAARSEDNCDDPEVGIHFRKRAENPAEHADECGISVLRATISSLAVRKEGLDVLEKRFGEVGAPFML